MLVSRLELSLYVSIKKSLIESSCQISRAGGLLDVHSPHDGGRFDRDREFAKKMERDCAGFVLWIRGVPAP